MLEALQELTRLAVHRQTGERTRMMLDVGGYRARRRAELTELGQDAAEEVRQTGEPKRLTPMTAFERKVVHDAVAAAGLRSESEGEDARPPRGGLPRRVRLVATARQESGPQPARWLSGPGGARLWRGLDRAVRQGLGELPARC